jgi:surface carbohydrate biosynthesis protein
MAFSIEKEWDAREKAGLPKYHSIDQDDIGFRFVEPSSSDPGLQAFLTGDFATMEAAWKGTSDVRACTTLQSIGRQPLEDLPPVEQIFSTPPGYLAWLACDENFFAQFGAKLLATIKGAAHVHLMDGDPAYAKEVIAYLDKPIGLTIEQPNAGPSYYHSVRFCRLAQLLRTREDPIALLDVDAIANRPVADLPTVPIGMRLRPGRIEPWNQCNASVVIATRQGQTYFDAVADYIFHFWERNLLRWQIDQTALYCVWKRLGVNIHTLNEQEVNYDYDDRGIIWCNSGRSKWHADDPTRQKFIEKSKEIEIPSPKATAHAKRERVAKRVAYLGCELKNRDLDGRLLVASHLCDMGVAVVVGHLWGINSNSGITTPGCQLFATANDIQAAFMQKAMLAGNYIIASDSEILALTDPLPNISALAVSTCDKFLLDTPLHVQALAEWFGNKKFIATGSPHLEYLVSTDIRPVDGEPYILFNTDLSIVNSALGSPIEALRALSKAKEISQSEAELMIKAETAALDMISPLIRWLAPQMRVVIRPHPSENAKAWREAFPDVEVVEGSSPHPWVKGAKLVIHANSTTGIEAAALGTPSLNLDPVQEWGEKFVINTYNYTAKTLSEAQAAITQFLNENSGPLAAGHAITAEIPRNGAANTAWHIADCLKTAKPLTGPFPWRLVDRSELQRSKFTVTQEELTERLSRLNFNGDISQIDDSTFLIQKLTAKPK